MTRWYGLVYPLTCYLLPLAMKIINNQKMYKPEEVAAMTDYHPRTIRRFIAMKRIKAVDSNRGGKQPVWWISEIELARFKKLLTIGSTDIGKKPRLKKGKA